LRKQITFQITLTSLPITQTGREKFFIISVSSGAGTEIPRFLILSLNPNALKPLSITIASVKTFLEKF
jgi:hypothetical protein